MPQDSKGARRGSPQQVRDHRGSTATSLLAKCSREASTWGSSGQDVALQSQKRWVWLPGSRNQKLLATENLVTDYMPRAPLPQGCTESLLESQGPACAGTFEIYRIEDWLESPKQSHSSANHPQTWPFPSHAAEPQEQKQRVAAGPLQATEARNLRSDSLFWPSARRPAASARLTVCQGTRNEDSSSAYQTRTTTDPSTGAPRASLCPARQSGTRCARPVGPKEQDVVPSHMYG